MSKGIRLRKSSHVKSSSNAALKDVVNKVMKVCKNGVFNVKHIDVDVQFECMQDELEGAEVDTVDVDDHVEEVERTIRTVKEGVRGIVQGLPFRRMHRLMARRMVEASKKI